MARKRERWLNMAWLHWLQGDQGGCSVTHAPGQLTPMRECMPTLVGIYRRYVEAEKDGDSYVLRVLPRDPDRESGAMSLGLAYRGLSLDCLFNQAVYELDCLNDSGVAYRAGRSEWQRWVP